MLGSYWGTKLKRELLTQAEGCCKGYLSLTGGKVRYWSDPYLWKHTPVQSQLMVWECLCVRPHLKPIFLFFWPHHRACRILVLWPGMEPVPFAVEAVVTTGTPGKSVKYSIYTSPFTISSYFIQGLEHYDTHTHTHTHTPTHPPHLVLEIKFYWHMAPPIYLHIIYIGRFSHPIAEWGICSRAELTHKSQNTSCLLREKVYWPLLWSFVHWIR